MAQSEDSISVDDAPSFGRADVEILSTETVYDGFFQMLRYRLRHRLIKGGWSPELKRECFKRGNAAAVLLYDPYKDAVVMLEQFRVGALDAPEGPWQMELVAGIIEPGETAEDVAHRESIEEAGAEALALEYICEYYPSPGGSSEKVSLFCGGVNSEGVGGAHGLPEEGEDIWVQVMDRGEAWQALEENYISNASTIIALQWLQMHWRRLQEMWQ